MPPTSLRARVLTIAVTALAFTLGVTALSAAPAHAAEPSRVLFDEDFEQAGSAPVLLTDYVGTGGKRYVADAGWLTACNGNVIAGSADDASQSAVNCTRKSAAANRVAYDALRQLAWALGKHNGMDDPWQNHVLAAFTDGANPGAGVQLRSADAIAVRPAGRYIALSVDAAALSCGATGPQYSFEVQDGSRTVSLGTSALCSDVDGYTLTVPAVAPATTARAARVSTVTSAGALKFTGDALTVIVRNANGSGIGNDAAVDNLRILDATPTLTVAAGSVNTVGDTGTLTYRISNTDDFAAKNGWTFGDVLPAGLTLADAPLLYACTDRDGSAMTAASPTSDLTAGSRSLSVTGDLPAGAASCTVTVAVQGAQGAFATNPASVTSAFLDTSAITAQTVSWGVPRDGDEAVRTPFNTAVSFDLLANFVPVSHDVTPAAPVRSSVRFDDGATEASTAQGVWTIADGVMTFAPASGYVGTTAPMPYSFRDENGNVVAATATVTVAGPILTTPRPSAPSSPVAPMPDEAPAPDETPMPDEVPAPDETPMPDEVPAPDEAPAPDETPAPDEVPAPDEAPVPVETPAPDEVPAPDEAPAPDETPAPDDAPAPDPIPDTGGDIIETEPGSDAGAGTPAPAEPAAPTDTVTPPAPTAPAPTAPTEQTDAVYIPAPTEQTDAVQIPAPEAPLAADEEGVTSAPAAVEPERALAATGAAATALPALTGVLLLMGGIALAFIRRTRRA